jgi:hypothetical protein
VRPADLTTDKHGRLYAPPGAAIGADDLDVIRSRKPEFVAFIRAEAEARLAAAEANKPALLA